MTDPSLSQIKDWPECYGADFVIELRKKGNPMFTKGAFGDISVALYHDGINKGVRLITVKTIVKSTVAVGGWGSTERKLSPGVFYELQALHRLNPHPHVVTLLAVYPARDDPMAGGTTLSLAFEYCPTDLFLTMEWRRRSVLPLLSLETIKTIASDLFSALNHCHSSNGILHRDVKPGNILVSSTGKVKLCDFGLAKPFSGGTSETGGSNAQDSGQQRGSRGVCTLHYRPPEVLMGGQAAHPAVDIYSAGVVIAELLIGRTMFPGVNDLDQIAKIFHCLGTPSKTHWPEAKQLPHGELTFAHKDPRDIAEFIPRCQESPHLTDFLRNCISLDPAQRLGSQQAVSHAWLQSGLASRSVLQEDLIPGALDEPFLLASSDRDITVATKQTLALARARRSFLKNLDCWSEKGNL
jgi:serine/threonine protein kinase